MQIYTIFSRLGNKLTNLFNLLPISSTITQKNKNKRSSEENLFRITAHHQPHYGPCTY